MDNHHPQIGGNRSVLPSTVREFLTTLFRHRRMVALTFLGTFLGAILAILLLPKQYEAQMKLLVRRERTDPVMTSDRTAPSPAGYEIREEELNSEVELLRSRDLLEKVVLACNLHVATRPAMWARVIHLIHGQGPERSQEAVEDVPGALRALEEKLQTDTIKKTNLIKVTYISTDPQQA